MSITSDLRSYADSAVQQAQAQLNDVTGQANELYGKTRENVADIAEKATEAVNDLRASAEKAVNVDALKAAVEPYLAQVKGYTTNVTDRAEGFIVGVKNDKRVAQLLDTATVVVDQVQERVIKPVVSLTGLGGKPATKPKAAPKPAPRATATKPAATKPAATKSTSRPAAKSTTARKAPAKRATKA